MLLISGYSVNFPTGKYCKESIIKYCNKFNHNYFTSESNLFIHPYSFKPKLLLSFLNAFKYICWIDADALITRFDIDFLNKLVLSKKDLYISKDHNDYNNGFFIIKSSLKMEKFLNDWYVGIINRKFKKEHDQDIFIKIFKNYYLDIELIDQKKYNAYPYKEIEAYGLPKIENCNQWDKNSYILHLCGINNISRLEILNKIWKY